MLMRAFIDYFKKLLMSPLGRQRNPRQNIWLLIVNIQEYRIAIVSSVITKIFTLASIGQSQHNLFKDTYLFSACIVSCRFLLFYIVYSLHIQNVPRNNVQRHNIQRHKVLATKRPNSKMSKIQNVPSLKTSQASKCPKPQNVPSLKTSQS